jgi:hypothetical protein
MIDVDAAVEDEYAGPPAARAARPCFRCVDCVERPLHVEETIVVSARRRVADRRSVERKGNVRDGRL